jgi:uncharacterized protein YyaL (SSP411 family)/aryl-alcohol dehydrogenase-like predicted oxidoreductase
MSEPRARNRLAQETSPYLRQHAGNPVDWHPWDETALTLASKEDKPIFLSIGYAACHWCHVMERESFEDENVARLLNEHFVCIKVDREERPDLDEIYMAATMALNGSGGWPMSVFLTPDQRPFFAGTYFPPSGRHGRPGFSDLLVKLAQLWDSDRTALIDQAQQLTAHVRAQSTPTPPAPVSARAIDHAVAALREAFEPKFGGFGPAPKFPPCSALSLLLRYHRRTHDSEALAMATKTLDGMKNGGIYDHVAGGFARYSTDERWLVPHFEKMLYDNAQLARVYVEAWQATTDPEYERVARETFDYVLREMQGPEGGFYSATDADSEGEEGKYFVWTQQEIVTLLGTEDATRFCAYYGASMGGNWEGKNILNTSHPLPVVARQLGVAPDELRATLRRGRQQLYEARQRRVAPLLDDKILCSWNGLMIGALAEGYRAFRDRRYLSAAQRAAGFLLETLTREDGGLFRTWRQGGRAHLDAYLEDYAYLGGGLLDLYEAAGDLDHLAQALALAERIVLDFSDAAQGDFFQTASAHEPLLVRAREGHDGALPSANAAAAGLLARLSYHFDRVDLRDRAVRALRAHGQQIERLPRAFVSALAVADLLLEGPVELVFAGPATATEPLEAEVGRHYLPSRVVAHVRSAATTGAVESALTRGKAAPAGETAALYVCRNFVCRTPVSLPQEVAAVLGDRQVVAEAERRDELLPSALPGRATAVGTARYGARHQIQLRPFGNVGASSLGFGGYRIVEHDADHRAALAAALQDGVNVIDTSTNYGGGSSETLVGQVLSTLVASDAIARDEIIVISKVGYVQGSDLDHARARASSGDGYPDMLEYEDDLWHCIHPHWLERQITRSLERLGLQTLDACLLHNPEYFLQDAARTSDRNVETTRSLFYARVERAFAHLEHEVARGRIAAYGVSSNTIAASSSDPSATSLERFLVAAERAKAVHFRVIQLPLNWVEHAAADSGGTVARARKAGLSVLANRPLNAIVGEGLLRLVDPPPIPEELPSVAAHLDAVAAAEEEFREIFAPQLRTPRGEPAPPDLLDWGARLDPVAERVTGLEQWNDIEHQLVRPQTRRVLDAMDAALGGDLRARWLTWRESYVAAVESLLGSLRWRAAEQSAHRVATLRRAFATAYPERADAPLSRLATWTVASVPGVTTVLVGMRRQAYVHDLRGVLHWPRLPNPERVFAAIRDAQKDD